MVVPDISFSIQRAIGNLFNLQGIFCESLVSPFWSLSYEMWFYILLGALAFTLTTKSHNKKYLGFFLFFVSTLVFVIGLKMHYLLIWLIGALSYLIRPSKKDSLVLWGAFFGFFICCVFWQFSKDTRSLDFVFKSINKEILELIMAFMASLFIQQVILFEPKNKLSIIIEKYIGKMANFSYTLYLSHRIVFLWIAAFILPKNTCSFTAIGLLYYGLILVITLVVCWLLYLISEKQTPRIRKKLKEIFIHS